MPNILTPEQLAARKAELASRPTPSSPVRPKVYTPYQFLSKFTQDERIAIRKAAQVDDRLSDFMYLLEHASEIQTTDPNLISGLSALVSAGLLTAQRKDEILK